MKTLLALSLLGLLSGCAFADYMLGIDENGIDLLGPAPMDYLSGMLKAFGTVGGLASVGLSLLGTAYVSNKRSKDPLRAVVNGIQQFKKDLKLEEEVFMVSKLKEYIPNKFHKDIDKIKDTL